MADNSTLPATGDIISTDEITTRNGAAIVTGEKVQRIKVGFGSDGVLRDVDSVNGLPVTGTFFQTTQPVSGPVTDVQLRATPLSVMLPAGKNKVTVDDTQSDIHGQLVGVTRITQIATKFFQQAPSAFLNITTSGGATATGPTAGAGVFSTSTAVTAALLAQTPVGVLYAAQYEAWAVLSGAYTAPTSAASFQRLGVYDVANGYSFGYNGLTFGLWVRANSVDTFIAQTAWNKDTLSGAATSLFTNNGAPVALAPTNMNMFRVRYGWYGAVSAYLEVYAPDGNWVLVHQVRTANLQTGTNLTVPDLPMTVEVSKTAADAINLSISCGGWAAGITAPSTGANLTGQRSLAALNAAVTIPLSGIGELSFAVSGTWSGTLAFQYSLDGLTWFADAALSNAGGFSTSTTVNSAFTAAVGSYRFYRVLFTAFASGSAGVVYSGSSSSNFVVSQTLITDGNNNGPASVKPAATAAVAADAALVVALHPSSPLPAGANNIGSLTPTTLAATGTAAANTGLTVSLPAAGVGLFHYITGIEIMRTATAALAGTATLIVSSTNLPGSLAWSFGNAMAAGATQRDESLVLATPLKSSVANTATTIVAPIPGLAVLWRINVYYYTAA